MKKPKPYYDRDGIVLYHGDCREILRQLPKVDLVLTDPPWPNTKSPIEGVAQAKELFYQAYCRLPGFQRMVVWLGCNTDPRFVDQIKEPFLRVLYLRRAIPNYVGRCLYTGDVCYCFGKWKPMEPHKKTIPGEYSVTNKPRLRIDHPCDRNEEHMRWVINWWSVPDETILDPFVGSGTTLMCAKQLGRKAIGIEIEEKYCKIAVDRIEAARAGKTYRQQKAGLKTLFEMEEKT